MLKKVLTIAAASALSTPAFAGFYVNVENNGSYIQGGAYLNNPDGADSETNFSGKVGGSVIASKNIDVYGEFSIVTDDTNSYASKIGLKYKFN